MWFYKEINKLMHYKKNLVAISGFPGMGLVGKTVVDYLKHYFKAKPVAKIYGYGFPAHLVSYDDGSADILHVEISLAEMDDLAILIITSDVQPINDRNQHSLGKYLAKKLREIGVQELIAAAAYVSDTTSHSRNVYVVGTESRVINKYVEKGAIPLSGGFVSGLNGIIVGWAKFYNLNAVCILGETWRSIVEMNYVDYTAAKIIIDLLNKVWNLNIDTAELDQQGLTVETQIKGIIDQYMRSLKGETPQERRPYYIT
jgi:predicted ATP-grasp superfamily ATP-dependent carboligase